MKLVTFELSSVTSGPGSFEQQVREICKKKMKKFSACMQLCCETLISLRVHNVGSRNKPIKTSDSENYCVKAD